MRLAKEERVESEQAIAVMAARDFPLNLQTLQAWEQSRYTPEALAAKALETFLSQVPNGYGCAGLREAVKVFCRGLGGNSPAPRRRPNDGLDRYTLRRRSIVYQPNCEPGTVRGNAGQMTVLNDQKIDGNA
ncbi:MAG: hypothetical protein JO151_11760 [Verrucomicrobia bacterium]|nr:hypothetical protein [Verrucomicrobiota bacterium]